MADLHLYRTDSLREDGRSLIYYDPVVPGADPPHRGTVALEDVRPVELGPEMRYNPLLGDYTICAGFRMDRPFLPASDKCPLCVGGYEAPEDYSVMVFDNRFPSVVLEPAPPKPGPHPPTEVLPGVGKCEVVCYSPEHAGSLSTMPVDQVYLLVNAWCDRYAELTSIDAIRMVLIFESRGVPVGVTLHHPHGQIYALSIVPPRVRTEKDNAFRAQAEGRCLFCDIVAGEQASAVRILAETERFLTVIPFAARYPYELHVYAKRHGCRSMLDFDETDRRELAGHLQLVSAKYDALFGEPMPSMMVFHQLHEEAEGYHFHVEFYPVMRAKGKLKYAASSETGGGLWLNDAYPERTIEDLRKTAPFELTLPSANIVGFTHRKA